MNTEATEERDRLTRLGEFLDSEEAPEGCMQLSELDGFLTGLAAGPEPVPMQKWMTEIWNGEEPVFADEAQSAEILGTILSRYESILATLEDRAWTISPLFWQTEEGVPVAGEWAEGFLTAIGLRIDAWRPLFVSRKQGVILMPILALCEPDDGEGNPFLPDVEIDAEILATFPKMIPESVFAIDRFWREREFTPQPIRKTVPAGRNDPCPCGSGKKYKRCCGA